MQMYRCTVQVDLQDAIEKTIVIVVAGNADAAALAACVHCQIAPSIASVETTRIKGNCYGIEQVTMRKPQSVVASAPLLDCESVSSIPLLRDAHVVQTSEQNRPRLRKRVVEVRATIFSRTDSAAYVGVGKAITERGKRGKFDTEFVQIETCSCSDDIERKPKNTRIEQNGAYTATKIYRN